MNRGRALVVHMSVCEVREREGGREGQVDRVESRRLGSHYPFWLLVFLLRFGSQSRSRSCVGDDDLTFMTFGRNPVNLYN